MTWISLYTSENWPNIPNYGTRWANLIHQCNYLASTHTAGVPTGTRRHPLKCTPAATTEGADLIRSVTPRGWKSDWSSFCLEMLVSCCLCHLSAVIPVIGTSASPSCCPYFCFFSTPKPAPPCTLWTPLLTFNPPSPLVLPDDMFPSCSISTAVTSQASWGMRILLN